MDSREESAAVSRSDSDLSTCKKEKCTVRERLIISSQDYVNTNN
jgi:hypothetical protein